MLLTIENKMNKQVLLKQPGGNVEENLSVQAVLRRHWNQYKIQFEHSFSHSDAMRTASYTVSSISDVQGYSYNHDCTSEHLNGKGYHDMESVVLKTEKLYG
ncbi:calcitonin gene-related peptide type 1 receptor [Limosa lapponica baueri]|uniref:Calcitonin gene-related peptide type 1 receptor n=1 Tax=Limosa lapponica baueri TaxID=1758121 RepID=A0A2I0T4I2_LIMLA|nr:calcitonin gene-related peptide type 1 receptor [Limosa lapponica baueri]